MYVIDQKIVTSDWLSTVNPHAIQAINIYEGAEAFIRYGSQADRNGVVVITLKKPAETIVAVTLKQAE